MFVIEPGMTWEKIEQKIATASQRDLIETTLLLLLKYMDYQTRPAIAPNEVPVDTPPPVMQ